MYLKFPFVNLRPQILTGVEKRILEKAAEMFLTLGVKSVTMDEIAGELGMSKKTIYAHYGTKTKLIEATALFMFERISQGIEDLSRGQKDPIEELFTIKDFALEHLRDERSSPQYQLQKYYPKIFASLKTRQQDLMEAYIQKNLKRGISEGVYRNEIPVVFTSQIYFVGMMGIKDRDIFLEKEYSMNQLINLHLEYHVRAIATEKGIHILNELLNTTAQ